MATTKTAMAIRNWIAGAALVLVVVGTATAAYAKVNDRITRNEASFAEIRELLVRVNNSVDGLHKEVAQLQIKVGKLEVNVAKLEVKVDILVQQNDGYEY